MIYNGSKQKGCPVEVKRNDSPTFVAFIGRLLSHQGINVLINAVSELAKQRCYVEVRIIGDSPTAYRLNCIARSNSPAFFGAKSWSA